MAVSRSALAAPMTSRQACLAVSTLRLRCCGVAVVAAGLTVMLWGYVITGAVGIAGIFGTLWQGKRGREAQAADLKVSLDAATANLKLGIDAENQRAYEAEKRRIYAAFLAKSAETQRALMEFRLFVKDDEKRLAAFREIVRARDAMASAAFEVGLIGSPDIRELVNEALAYFRNYHKATAEGAKVTEPQKPGEPTMNEVQQKLMLAMRTDLGEPVEEA